jgi:Flp pilus assembly protein TadD
LRPDSAAAHYQLASVLARRGDTQQAVQHYRAALQVLPDFPEALNNLAWILAAEPTDSLRNGAEAIKLAERACVLTAYGEPLMIGTLGAAYAESGRFAEAVAMAEKARALAEQLHEPELAAKNLMLLGLYRSGQPYREKP